MSIQSILDPTLECLNNRLAFWYHTALSSIPINLRALGILTLMLQSTFLFFLSTVTEVYVRLRFVPLSKWYWARTREEASHDLISIPLGYRSHEYWPETDECDSDSDADLSI
ncbi:hypothetical protein TNCV_2900931 [Trichonephila clavipes]|nr:hypothetical protein TNCV_2900931 [Trichonephila clavipes]